MRKSLCLVAEDKGLMHTGSMLLKRIVFDIYLLKVKYPATGGGPPFVMPETSQRISEIYGGTDSEVFSGLASGVETSVQGSAEHSEFLECSVQN